MSSARWSSPGFRAELVAFVGAAVGEPRVLEPVRLRPWSTVWRAETPSGVFFAKESCAGQRHEAALVSRLATLAPGLVVPVVAHDPATGLVLTPDQGPTLQDRRADDLATWRRVVVAAAEVQRRVPSSALHGLGLVELVPDRAATDAEHYLHLLVDLPDGDPRRLHPDAAARVRARLPRIREWGAEVAALGLPLALNHNDLHTDNVVEVDGALRFLDFADAVVSDPLGVLRVPAENLAALLGTHADDPRVAAALDPALEVWSDVVPLPALRAILPTALRLGRLGRVEPWWRCLLTMDDAELAEWGGSPARWLTMLADG